MSTRARIGLRTADSMVESVYLHWDGYPQYAGMTLMKAWNTRAILVRLLAMGNMSAIGVKFGEKHDFENHGKEHPDWCLFYNRDRASPYDKSWRKSTNITLAAYYLNAYHCNAEWAYLFDNDQWFVTAVEKRDPSSARWVPLAQCLGMEPFALLPNRFTVA